MKTCDQCRASNGAAAKFCSECGAKLSVAVEEADSNSVNQADHPYDLDSCIKHAREKIKKDKQPIPSSSNPMILALTESLRAIPPEAQAARISIVEALGKSRDPAVLPSLLQLSGARAKDVRKSVSIALGSIRHPLSAYLLMPMLLDESSRVRNAAIQAMLHNWHPYCADVIVAACVKSNTFKNITADTIRLMAPDVRSRFQQTMSTISAHGNQQVQNVLSGFLDQCRQAGDSGRNLSEERFQTPSGGGSASRSFSEANSTAGVGRATTAPNGVDQRQMLESHMSLEFDALRMVKNSEPEIDIHNRGLAEVVNSTLSDSAPEVPLQKRQGSSDSFADLNFFESLSGDMQDSSVDLSKHQNGSHSANGSGISDQAVRNGRAAAAASSSNSELMLKPALGSGDSFADFNYFQALSAGLNDSDQSTEMLKQGRQVVADRHAAASSFPTSNAQAVPSRSTSPFAANTPPNAFSMGGVTPGEMAVPGYPVVGRTPGEFGAVGLPTPAYPQQPAYSQPAYSPAAYPQVPYAQPPVSQAGYGSAVHPPSGLSALNGVMPAFAPTGIPIAGHTSAEFTPMLPQAVPVSQNALIASSASSLIPAFASGSAVHAVRPVVAGGLETQSASGVQTSSAGQSSTVTATTSPSSGSQIVALSQTTGNVSALEEEAAAAVQARQLNEVNLKRLRDAREKAFHEILESRESIDKKTPMLLSRKISALMATPSGDAERVSQLIGQLGQSKSPQVIEAIGSFCQKPAKEIRIACAEALGLVPHQAAAVLLMKLLSDKSGTVIERAVASLIQINQPTVRMVILAAGLINSSLRSVVLSGIESATEEAKSGWEQFLLTLIASESDSELVAFSVSILSRLTAATHVEIFQKFVKHSASSIRAASVDALVRTGSKRVIGEINESLLDEDPKVRTQAAVAVATIHSPRSIEVLGKLLSDSDLGVRRAAAQSMSRIDESDLVPAIVSALNTETDATTVESLLSALNRNGNKESIEVLIRYLEGEAGQYRELALKALRKLKSPETIPVFKRLLDDNNPSFRRQSVEQLALLKVEKVLPRIREMLKRDTDEVVRGACAKALGEFQDRSSVEVLEEALEDHEAVRLQAVIALGRLGQQSAGPVLLNLLSDNRPEIRYQSVRAIGQLKLEGCEDLIHKLLHDKDEMVRRGAEQTLQDFGFTKSQLNRRRAWHKFVSLSSKLAPSVIVGAIPGGTRTLAGVMVACLAFAAYWGMQGIQFASGSGEGDLPVGWVRTLDVNAKSNIVAAMREDFILDIWSISDSKLTARLSVPETTTSAITEPQGGVILVMGNSLGRLDAASNYAVDTMLKIELPGPPSALVFHNESSSLCAFVKEGGGTSLKVLSTSDLKETQSFKINGPFDGNCTVSPDFSVAATLDAGGTLKLADLKSGKIVSAPVANLLKFNQKLGRVNSVCLTGDSKYYVFSAVGGCEILNSRTLKPVKSIPSPDAYGFVTARPANSGSDLVLLSASGAVYNITDEFKTVTESRIELDQSFDVAAMSGAGEVVAVGNTEQYDFDVYSAAEKRTLMKSTH